MGDYVSVVEEWVLEVAQWGQRSWWSDLNDLLEQEPSVNPEAQPCDLDQHCDWG